MKRPSTPKKMALIAFLSLAVAHTASACEDFGLGDLSENYDCHEIAQGLYNGGITPEKSRFQNKAYRGRSYDRLGSSYTALLYGDDDRVAFTGLAVWKMPNPLSTYSDFYSLLTELEQTPPFMEEDNALKTTYYNTVEESRTGIREIRENGEFLVERRHTVEQPVENSGYSLFRLIDAEALK